MRHSRSFPLGALALAAANAQCGSAAEWQGKVDVTPVSRPAIEACGKGELTEEGGRALVRRPYLQSVSEDSASIVWAAKPGGSYVVIGGGDGGTVREVLRYREVESVTLVELDKMVVEASQQHLTEMKVPWNDPRLTVRCEDGVAYLRDYQGEPFDVILVDGPDPVGPAEGLFQSPFYSACKARLRPEGVLATQSEAPMLMREDFVRIVKTLRSVFPKAQPYFGPVPIYVCGTWSWTIAGGANATFAPREERLAEIEAGCRYYNRDVHRAAFTLPNDLRKLL